MTTEKEQQENPRKFLGIYFQCCNTYGRLYKNQTGTHYIGRCPRCMRTLKVPIGEGGVSTRFFRAN